MLKGKQKIFVVVFILISILFSTVNIIAFATENEIIDNTTTNETNNENEENPTVSDTYTVSWSYNTIQNGTIAIVDGEGITCVSNDANGGEYKIKVGTTVKIKCVPNYGYQFMGIYLDGVDTTTKYIFYSNEVNTYHFKMPSRDIVLSNHFELQKQFHSNEAEGRSSKKIAYLRVNNLENSVNYGTTKASYGAATVSDSIKSAMETVATNAGVTIFEYLNISLVNKTRKGGERTEYWETNLTELTSPANVVIGLSTNKDQTPYKVIRYHNGSAELLDVQYDEDNQTISDSFLAMGRRNLSFCWTGYY